MVLDPACPDPSSPSPFRVRVRGRTSGRACTTACPDTRSNPVPSISSAPLPPLVSRLWEETHGSVRSRIVRQAGGSSDGDRDDARRRRRPGRRRGIRSRSRGRGRGGGVLSLEVLVSVPAETPGVVGGAGRGQCQRRKSDEEECRREHLGRLMGGSGSVVCGGAMRADKRACSYYRCYFDNEGRHRG